MPKSNTSRKNGAKKMNKIYLDFASGAKEKEANPGSIHEFGLSEKRKLENSRMAVAQFLGARPYEIVFTSGATESNNLAILGLVNNFKKPHIITTNIEHSSVLEVFKHLRDAKKAEVTFVEVEKNGIVDPKKIGKLIKKNTILVSVMYANNEIGTIQPTEEIAREIRRFKKSKEGVLKNKIFPIFHTDATQAINYLPVRVDKLGVDMLSFNGAKIYGPKGIGVLYVKKGVPLKKIMFGGEQEMGLRPGTENVSLISSLAESLICVEKTKDKETKRLITLRDYFIKKLKTLESVAGEVIFNGDLKNRLPNNINITIPGIPSDLLVIELSAKGIMTAGKSACKSGDGKASYVIKAINKNIEDTDGSVRFSLGRSTTKKEIDFTIKALSQILLKLKKWYN